MSTLTIELPPQAAQTECNLRRWTELLADPELAKIEWRIETDRYGHVVMMPPPAPRHGRFQSRIAYLFQTLLPSGETLTKCPISTADGVKGADVAWESSECIAELGENNCFPRAPEICVEVLSPGNTEAEVREKMALYFDAGAKEVWVCCNLGVMTFFGTGSSPLEASELCPSFPGRIILR